MDAPAVCELQHAKDIGRLSFTVTVRYGVTVRPVTSLRWAYGDEKKYGERKKATEAGGLLEGLNFQTAKQYGWVASKVPTSRRRDVLSFQHHQEVAALPAAAQTKWLALATLSPRLRRGPRGAFRVCRHGGGRSDTLRPINGRGALATCRHGAGLSLPQLIYEPPDMGCAGVGLSAPSLLHPAAGKHSRSTSRESRAAPKRAASLCSY